MNSETSPPMSEKIPDSHHGERLPVEALAHRFAQCESEPSMRSLSAVLRITREQLRVRDNLGMYPTATFVCLGISVVLFGVLPFLPKEARDMVFKLTLGGPIITLIFAYATWSSRDMRRAYVQQEKEIRAMATRSLERILAHDFKMKPLLREQVDTLRVLVKHHPEATRLRDLLGR